jgi:CyaY protein
MKPTAQEYGRRADECLAVVARWLERFDPDELDYSTSDGVVTLEFADRTRYVLNRQSAVAQMWFAAGAQAWHYDWDEGGQRWRCDKDGHELLARVCEVVGTKLGQPLPPLT